MPTEQRRGRKIAMDKMDKEALDAFLTQEHTCRLATSSDGRHAWLGLVPGKVTGWDFRKLPG